MINPVAQVMLENAWDQINGLTTEDQTEENKARSLDHATNYRIAFATEAGQIVLKDLIDKCLCQVIIRPGEDVKADAVRQGMANVVRHILLKIHEAETGGAI